MAKIMSEKFIDWLSENNIISNDVFRVLVDIQINREIVIYSATKEHNSNFSAWPNLQDRPTLILSERLMAWLSKLSKINIDNCYRVIIDATREKPLMASYQLYVDGSALTDKPLRELMLSRKVRIEGGISR